MTTQPVLYPQQAELSKGSLVGYNLQKGPAIGIVTRNGKGAIQLFIKSQKEFTVKNRAIFVGAGNFNNLDRPGWVKLLQERENKVGELSSQVDLEFLHACVLEESSSKEYSFDDLLNLYYGEDYGFEEIISLAQSLSCDKCYFKRRKDCYIPNSLQQIKQYQAEQKRREETRRKEEHLVQFLKEPSTPMERDLPPEEKSALEDLGIHYEKSVFYKGWLRILQDAGIRSKFQLRRVLISRGFFSPTELFEAREASYPLGFSKNFLEFVEGWRPCEETGPFEDLRALKTFTVDNEDTLDRDDALSYDPETGFFYVHIINVARIVNGDQRFEKELRKRLTSLYLPEGHFSMFPEKVVKEILSLDEGTQRHVLSVRFKRGRDGLEFEIIPALISIDENLSYSQFLGSQKDARVFYEESQRLREDRFDRGAIEYQHRDVDIHLEEERVRVFERSHYPAQRVISEFSIIANSLFARFAHEHEIPILYRSQKGNIEDVKKHPLFCNEVRDFFTYHRLRPLWAKTRWDTSEVSHFHLGVPFYTQLSSPIRRFIDYLNQKQIWNYFLGLDFLSREELNQDFYGIQSHLFEVGGIQSKREFYYLLRFMEQESKEQGTDFETEVTVLDVGEDWISFHLDEYERILRFKQDPSDFEPGMSAVLRVREIDLVERELKGIVVKKSSAAYSAGGSWQ